MLPEVDVAQAELARERLRDPVLGDEAQIGQRAPELALERGVVGTRRRARGGEEEERGCEREEPAAHPRHSRKDRGGRQVGPRAGER